MRICTFSLLLFLVAPTIPAADSPGNPKLAADTKPGDRPIPPKDAPKAMTVPDGFKVTLFAGEPDVVQPIAFTFDDRGRMWVVECLSYPNWKRDGTGSDRVIILEDTDGDGTFDKKTVFLDNGSNLSGIEVGFGGVWLCSSPNLIFIPIKEGEDKPSGKPVVVLDGWNMIDTKHNIFNSLGWGPDGWLYGCNGIQAKAWVGAPGTPKDERTYLDCGVWRYHPTLKVFEAVAHGTTNPFGLDWDEYGEMFITNCVIDHLFHFVPGGHYVRMYGQDANPYVYGLMKSCVDYKHWASGDWTSSRSTGPGGKPEHSDAGGGHAHAGCAIYLGDNFPAEYRNTLFTCNIHGNRLNNDGLARTPSGYKGVRRKDFLFANDSWFRGICVKTGPDGALYVSDWCDTGECHNYDKCDTTNGRIYRVSYGNPKQWKGDVSKLTDAELVKMAVFSGNDWFVRHARRVIQERAADRKLDKDTPAALRKELMEKHDEVYRLRALWALAVTGKSLWSLALPGELTSSELYPLLTEEGEALRAWAYRLVIAGEPTAKWDKKTASQLQGSIVKLVANEESVYVLLAIASECERVHHGSQLDLCRLLIPKLIDAVRTDSDPKFVQMVWYAMQQHPQTTERDVLSARNPTLRRNALRYRLATSFGPALNAAVYMLGRTESDDIRFDILLVLRETLAGMKSVTAPTIWSPVYAQLLKDGNKDVQREAKAVAVLLGDQDAISQLVKVLTDSKADAAERRSAIELLLPRKLPDFGKTLRVLLDDPAVRQSAIRGLAAFPDADTPAALLKAYPKFTAAEKLDAVNTLAARAAWASALLDAVEKKDIPRTDIPVATARQILALNDKALAQKFETVWGKITPASKERVALMKKWKEQLTEATLAKGDATNGRAVFVKHCGACHKMFGEGGAVGPELTGSQRANLDYVLENVLDPSAVVPNEYRLINFTLTDERVVGGIILRETKDAITIRTPNETVVFPISEIASRKQTNLSIMPDGLFDAMKPDEVRDLVMYLRAKEQVPVPK
jgi:putative membrane-bound dehydrogenase-like protein